MIYCKVGKKKKKKKTCLISELNSTMDNFIWPRLPMNQTLQRKIVGGPVMLHG
jgi:hypothetical protein